MPIYVTRSSMPSLEDYVKEIRPIFENHTLTNMGECKLFMLRRRCRNWQRKHRIPHIFSDWMRIVAHRSEKINV